MVSVYIPRSRWWEEHDVSRCPQGIEPRPTQLQHPSKHQIESPPPTCRPQEAQRRKSPSLSSSTHSPLSEITHVPVWPKDHAVVVL